MIGSMRKLGLCREAILVSAMLVVAVCRAEPPTDGVSAGQQVSHQRGGSARGPLRVHPDNPRYFTDGSGRAVYLTGSHTWPNVVDMGPTDPPVPFDFTSYLDFLERYGHSFTRLWTWDLFVWHTQEKTNDRFHHVSPQPYARTGPGLALDGKPKFDLTRFEPAYFERLRDRADQAGKRGIYVSVMLFEGCILQSSPEHWRAHPYHPQNNINGIDADTNGDGIGVEVHTLGNPAVIRIQEDYVRHVVDAVNHLDNILYEISNENHPESTEWQYHLIRFVRKYEQTRPKQHPVGMTFQYKGGKNSTLFASPADWISPNAEDGYRDNPPASDGRKVILSDTDHLWGMGGNRQWVWRSFLRGLNPIFMDPYDGQVLGKSDGARWEPIRLNMGYTRRYAERMNLAGMTPRNDLASSGYCLAHVPAIGAASRSSPNGGRDHAELLAYLPDGGTVVMDLRGCPGMLKVEWFNPDVGKTHAAPDVQGGARQPLAAPFAGDAVLYITEPILKKRKE